MHSKAKFGFQSRYLIGILVMFSGTIACKARETATENSEVKAAASTTAPTSSGLVLPTPGSSNNPISPADQAAILKGWRQIDQEFYKTQSGYERATVPPPKSAETTQCMGVCPDYYSSLVCHYYCWNPSYQQVIPNVRGCFSNIARSSVLRTNPTRPMFYPEIYDYCLYQPYDVVKFSGKPPPVYSQSTIDANKKAKPQRKLGVMKWIDDNQPDVFKYIMFTFFNPFTYAIEDQQAIINDFYKVDLKGKTTYAATDTAQVAECQKKRPRLRFEPNGGVHCSYDMDTTAFSQHPNFKDNVAYLKTLPPGHNAPGNTTPAPPGSHTSPISAAFTLQKGTYKTKKTTNSSCEIVINNIHTDSSTGDLKWFHITYGPNCIAEGKKVKSGTKVTASDCGGNDCDFKLDKSDPNILQIKDNDKFSIKFDDYKENWYFDRP